MKRLITAKDIAVRDNQPNVREWIRFTSIQLKLKDPSLVAFDGDVRGVPVFAFISNSRWQALCDQPGCGGCEYVDPAEPIFFCLTCSNGRSGKARPVKFPRDRAAIESALLERDMIPVVGGDVVMQTYNARPAHPELRRDWIPRELEGHPLLVGRVIAKAGESARMIHRKTTEIRDASNI